MPPGATSSNHNHNRTTGCSPSAPERYPHVLTLKASEQHGCTWSPTL
ncbi:hypothetical protein I553_1644 [Mycobacterium xenopi 4042]|uniref:Uncharacterized protein n=1 Tax=Mycobacterium xenopi 4042 TaxID=1299334 RepID=X8CDM3_MYCXE|nr:hypothetical protein I553_1644 [Mycobacterium xenopi 4042]